MQINILGQSEGGVLPQQGISRTIQENKPKLLDTVHNHLQVKHVSLMIHLVRYYVYVLQRYNKGILSHWVNTHVLNRGLGVRSPLD